MNLPLGHTFFGKSLNLEALKASPTTVLIIKTVPCCEISNELWLTKKPSERK